MSNPSTAVITHHVQWRVTEDGTWDVVGSSGAERVGKEERVVTAYTGQMQVAGETSTVKLSFDPDQQAGYVCG